MKKVTVFAILFVFLIVIIVPSVFAALGDVGDSVGKSMELTLKMLAGLGNAAGLDSPEAKLGFIRFLTGLAVFTVVYAGVSRIPAFNNRTASMLALIFAGFSLLLDPETMFAFGSFYTIIIAAMVIGGPTLGVLWLAFALPRDGWMRFFSVILSIAWIALVYWAAEILKGITV